MDIKVNGEGIVSYITLVFEHENCFVLEIGLKDRATKVIGISEKEIHFEANGTYFSVSVECKGNWIIFQELSRYTCFATFLRRETLEEAKELYP